MLGHEEIDELGALGGFTIHSGSRGEEVGFGRLGKKQRRSGAKTGGWCLGGAGYGRGWWFAAAIWAALKNREGSERIWIGRSAALVGWAMGSREIV